MDSQIPPVRMVVGPPGSGKTYFCRRTALHQPRVLWLDPSRTERLSDRAIRSTSAASVARTIRARTAFEVVYYPVGESAREGPGQVMEAAAVKHGRVHVVVDEHRLLVGRGRRTLPGFDEHLRTHRHHDLSGDLISQRLADAHPDASTVVQRVIIFGAASPADREKIRKDYGREVLTSVEQLRQYEYVFVCTQTGITGTRGGREQIA